MDVCSGMVFWLRLSSSRSLCRWLFVVGFLGVFVLVFVGVFVGIFVGGFLDVFVDGFVGVFVDVFVGVFVGGFVGRVANRGQLYTSLPKIAGESIFGRV